MNKHFLDRCAFVAVFDDPFKEQVIKDMLFNKAMVNTFKKRCIGIAMEDLYALDSGFLVSKSHAQLLKNITSLSKRKFLTGLREKYLGRLRRFEKQGVTPLIGTRLDFESVIPFVDRSVRITVDTDNTIIIPTVLSYKEWIEVTKATDPEGFDTPSTLRRRALIFRTIRHSIGIYDAAWQKLPAKCYGYICRKLVSTVCRRFPELDNVAKQWLEQKAEKTDIDQFDLDPDFIVGSDKFLWLPDNYYTAKNTG